MRIEFRIKKRLKKEKTSKFLKIKIKGFKIRLTIRQNYKKSKKDPMKTIRIFRIIKIKLIIKAIVNKIESICIIYSIQLYYNIKNHYQIQNRIIISYYISKY